LPSSFWKYRLPQEDITIILRSCQLSCVVVGVDRWIIFDNSGDVPEVTAFEESGKLEIVDSDRFTLLLRYKEKQWKK